MATHQETLASAVAPLFLPKARKAGRALNARKRRKSGQDKRESLLMREIPYRRLGSHIPTSPHGGSSLLHLSTFDPYLSHHSAASFRSMQHYIRLKQRPLQGICACTNISCLNLLGRMITIRARYYRYVQDSLPIYLPLFLRRPARHPGVFSDVTFAAEVPALHHGYHL